MTSPTTQPADTSEMVDRVVFAIRESYGCEDEFRACDPDYCSCRRVAEQAIAAMREPTEAMADAGTKVIATQHQRRWSPPIWRAMIDAALSSPEIPVSSETDP